MLLRVENTTAPAASSSSARYWMASIVVMAAQGQASSNQHDGRYRPVQTQQGEQPQPQRRDQQHPHPQRAEQAGIAQQLFQVAGGDGDAGDDHGKRRIHIPHQADRFGNRPRHRDAAEVDHQPGRHRQDAGRRDDTAHDLFGIHLAGEHRRAYGKDEDIEHREEGAGVEHALCAEQRPDQREAHVPGVGKRTGEPDQRAFFFRRPPRGRRRNEDAGCQHHSAQPEGQQQIVKGGRVKFYHIGVQHHGRDDQIQQQIGQHRLVGRLENPQFAAGCARQDHKQQFHDLFGRNDGQIHLYTRSPSLKNQKNTVCTIYFTSPLVKNFCSRTQNSA